MRKVILIIAISFVIFNLTFVIANAQSRSQARIDSLLKELPKMKEDTTKINLLATLSFEFYFMKPEEGIKFGEQGLNISDKLNWKIGKAKCYNSLGSNYRTLSNYEKSLHYYSKALKINEELGNKHELALNLGNIGLIYQDQSDYEKSLEYHFRALKINEELGNKSGLAINYDNIGNIYLFQSNSSKSLEYFLKALKINEELGNKSRIGRSLGNIGNFYHHQSEHTKSLEYYFKSLKIFEELGNKIGIALNLSNIGYNYLLIAEYSKANEYYLRSLKIYEELGNKSGRAVNLGNIGELFLVQAEDSVIQKNQNRNELLSKRNENLKNAIKYLTESINIYREIGGVDNQSSFLKRISMAYELNGDYQKALESFKEYKILQDSVFSLEKQKGIANLEARKELEIKEKENQLLIKDNQLFNAELLQKNQKISLAQKEQEVQHLAFLKEKAERQEKEKQLSLSETQMKLQQSQIETLDRAKEKQNAELKAKSLQRNFLIAGAFVFIILFLIAFIRFREKKKLSEQLEAQKNEIESQKYLLQEKNTEIVDSINYAATIQNALLPWSSVLSKSFKEHFVIYKPKDIVSGDSYWFQEVDGVKYLAVIDCTGHGVPGSMLTVIANSVLDDAVLSKKLTSTSEILTYMNEKVTEVLNQRLAENSIRDGMEVALIAIHKDKIQFSGAGRPLYVKNGKLETYKTDKRGIAGQNDNDIYNYSSVEIEKTDNLLLYLSSDGYADQMNENSKKYSTKKFIETLDKISELQLDKQKEILENEFNSHKGNREQIDDVTVIGVRI